MDLSAATMAVGDMLGAGAENMVRLPRTLTPLASIISNTTTPRQHRMNAMVKEFRAHWSSPLAMQQSLSCRADAHLLESYHRM